ncbi:MAG: dephospho-CoA kinase [Candidatus Omnitrophota bacterium]
MPKNKGMDEKKTVVIGVTGGVASGKTMVADIFAAKGAVKIDADKIAHTILKENQRVKREIITFFGKNILSNGQIDRKKLAREVFSDKNSLTELCRIMHPEIISRIKHEVELVKTGVVVIDAPLLIESGLNDYVDIVVLVSAAEELQIKRAVSRGISEIEAKEIIMNQMPLSEKAEYADYIIDNTKNLSNLRKGAELTWKRIKEKKKS